MSNIPQVPALERKATRLPHKPHTYMLARLAEHIGAAAEIPVIFRDRRMHPLKVGITSDLLERFPEAHVGRLKAWMMMWTRKHQYMCAVATVDRRFDLDGNDAGPVDPEHKAFATSSIVQVRGARAKQRAKMAKAEAPKVEPATALTPVISDALRAKGTLKLAAPVAAPTRQRTVVTVVVTKKRRTITKAA
jgi:sRNA-binding protein